jgi:hypothetical protein
VNARYKDLGSLSGPLKPEVLVRLEAFFANPCDETWNDASTILLTTSPRMLTFWQAVRAVDPSYPFMKRGPNWPRVPDFFTARRALEYARTGRT